MLRILDRYLVRENPAAVLPGAGRSSRSCCMMPPILDNGAAADREGRRLVTVATILLTLDAAGAQRHDSDGAALSAF